MLSIGRASMIGFLIRRSLASGYDTYLLTSDQIEDEILEREAYSENVTGVIKGKINDVRSRYLSLSKITRCDYLVRVTGDNPFTDFRAIEPLVKHLVDTNSHYSWLDPGCCPDGINLEVFTPHLLQESVRCSDLHEDLEHVTPWMKKHQRGKGLWLDWYPRESSNYHLGIDIKEDYFKITELLGDRIFDSELFKSPDIIDSLIQSMINSPAYPKYRRHVL